MMEPMQRGRARAHRDRREVADLRGGRPAASGRATVRVDPAGFERAAAAAALARRLAAQHPVYGRTTGVGANRSQAVPGTTRARTACGCCAATRAAAAR